MSVRVSMFVCYVCVIVCMYMCMCVCVCVCVCVDLSNVCKVVQQVEGLSHKFFVSVCFVCALKFKS